MRELVMKSSARGAYGDQIGDCDVVVAISRVPCVQRRPKVTNGRELGHLGASCSFGSRSLGKLSPTSTQ